MYILTVVFLSLLLLSVSAKRHDPFQSFRPALIWLFSKQLVDGNLYAIRKWIMK